ncbi:MAG: hypothetical protein Phog2KO_32790 [Phototrophicaceae bacterium]
MLSEKHRQLIKQLSREDATCEDLEKAIESIVDEKTQQIQHERDLAYDYINQVATALLSLDVDGFVTLINKHICDLTGYSYDELMLQNWFDLCIPENERENMKKRYTEVITGKLKPSDYYENYIITKSGDKRLVAWHNSYHRDAKTGEILGSFSSGEDITNIKESEQLLQETQEQLNAILDGVVDGVAVVSADEKILYANDAAAIILGFESATEMITSVQNMLLINNEPYDEDGNLLRFEQQALYQALQGQIPPPQTILFKNHLTDAEIWVDTKAKPIFDEQGNVRFAVITLNDITRTRQIEKVKFDLLQEKAQIDTLREFIAKTTHDLSQPLSVINTAIYMLDKSIRHDLVQKRTNIIRTQSLRIQSILRDIQQMSILDGMRDISISFVDPQSIFKQIIAYGKSVAQAKQINFSNDIDFSSKIILGNQLYLDRAIMQVLQNAFDYTPVGGDIHMRYYEQDDDAILEIHDTGIGIEETHLKHIFDRFYRVDKSRTSDTGSASGLGLAIAKRVMELHKGKIEVESTIGKGSIFRLYLPLSPIERK